MAQPVFDEHPLGEYLRDAGENVAAMPGISHQLECEIDPYRGLSDDDAEEVSIDCSDYYPQVLFELVQIFQWIASPWNPHTPSRSFIERFKYRIISSSLLASSLQTPNLGRSGGMSIPGRLAHSRTPSADLYAESQPSATAASPPEVSISSLSAAAAGVAALYSAGYPLLGLSALLATAYFAYTTISTKETIDMTPTLHALDEILTANETWDSVVQDALSVIDNDELQLAQSLSNSAPPSPVRVALFSCLQTTQTQCDNVRHLFAALTSPTELSQLSEMYAPTSPIKPAFTLDTHPRPLSFPAHRSKSSTDFPVTPENKRSTWSGPYASLASAGSPTSSINRRKDKHRANLPDIFYTRPTSVSNTPALFSPKLDDVSEGSATEEEAASTSNYFSPSTSHFGAAALDLQRRRKSGGMEALSPPPHRSMGSDLRSSRGAVFTPSRFTHVQTTRHPLSLSSLHHTLQGAMASKRYACSHLLALRFSEEEEEGYWEDVRSLMNLLTSALIDASTRLSQALDEADRQKLSDQTLTPETSLDISDHDNEADLLSISPGSPTKRRKFDAKVSFAPLPNHLSRFAAHVAAISSSLDDARDHLEQVVASLKGPEGPPGSSSPAAPKLRHSRSFSRALSSIPGAEAESDEHPAVLAYERLRREIGLALRECERGRERLLEIVRTPVPSEDEDEGLDDLPGLGHDASDDSDKPDPTSPFSEDEDGLLSASIPHGAATALVANVIDGDGGLDDVTSHLLMGATAQHLPLPGIEEVFEAETDSKVGTYNRERPKLSREDRIKAAKSRRESGLGLAITPKGDHQEKVSGTEKWGPGGEVVQELKDVIWKVSEKRRKMADSNTPAALVDAPPTEGDETRRPFVLPTPPASQED